MVLSDPADTLAPMGIRQLRSGALSGDDRELQARLIHTLNQLQAANEKCRGLLINGNLDSLVTMGRKIVDLGTLLMMTAADGSPAELFDPRARAAGEHLDR